MGMKYSFDARFELGPCQGEDDAALRDTAKVGECEASNPGGQSPPDLAYDGFQSPAAGPASGRVSPESHDAIVTINAWS